MDIVWLFFAGFTFAGSMLGYGIALVRHGKAIDAALTTGVDND